MGPEGSKSHVTTRVMGTYGYAAPEYISTGNFSYKWVNEEINETLTQIHTPNTTLPTET